MYVVTRDGRDIHLPPAEEPGFETGANPNEEELGPEHLPDTVLDKVPGRWKLSDGLGLGGLL